MTLNYYKILGVKNSASYDDIKRAWREKAKQCHPDKFQSPKEKVDAHRKFIDITEAYTVLIDATKGVSYDSKLDDAQPNRPYTGYEKASPANDQQEVSDAYRDILGETLWEFTKMTFFVLLMLPPCALFGIVGPILMLLGFGESQPDFRGLMRPDSWGIIILVAFFALCSIGLSMSLYYRVKRITEWVILKARGQRLFSKDLVR